MKISPKKVTVSTGVVIELSSNDATHLSYALGGFLLLMKEHGYNGARQWPWISSFIKQLDVARGSGCTMGGRLEE